MINIKIILFGMLILHSSVNFAAEKLTVADLRQLGTFNLEEGILRKQVQDYFGEGNSSYWGQGGEKAYALCFSLPKKYQTKYPVRSVFALFSSKSNDAVLSGFKLTKKYFNCPEIKNNIIYLENDKLLNLTTLSINQLMTVLPTETSSVASIGNEITRIYEEKKEYQPSDKFFKPSLAYEISGNRGKAYQIDATTTLNIFFEKMNFFKSYNMVYANILRYFDNMKYASICRNLFR